MTESEPSDRSRAWPRAVLEACIIVGSILLAFGIQAWWEGYGDGQLIEELYSQLQSQMTENLAVLDADQVSAEAALAAGRQLIDVIGPDPTIISSDSLVRLVGAAITLGRTDDLEMSALEALLGDGELSISETAFLQSQLIRFRSGVRRYSRDLELFVDNREDLIRYLVSHGAAGAITGVVGIHSPSDFQIPVERLLSDPELEGRLGNVVVRAELRRGSGESLHALADSILTAVATGAT